MIFRKIWHYLSGIMTTFVQMTIFRNAGKSISCRPANMSCFTSTQLHSAIDTFTLTLLDKVTDLWLIRLNVYFYLSYESDPKSEGYRVLDMSSLFFQIGPGLLLLFFVNRFSLLLTGFPVQLRPLRFKHVLYILVTQVTPVHKMLQIF